VIGNPVPVLTRLDDKAIRDNLTKLLFVGRFDLHKGGDVVLEAFVEIAKKNPIAQLTFVGPDTGVSIDHGKCQYINTVLDDLPVAIRERIDYRGQLTKSEIEALRYEHGIAIVASRYETFGYTAFEAMSCGMPLVTTAAGGLPEYISNELDGLIVADNDAKALADACLRYLDDPDLAVRIGAQAHKTIQDRLSPAQVARQTEAFVRLVQKERDN